MFNNELSVILTLLKKGPEKCVELLVQKVSLLPFFKYICVFVATK